MAKALQVRLPAKLASTEESDWPQYLDDANLCPGGWFCLASSRDRPVSDSFCFELASKLLVVCILQILGSTPSM
jgi:hypothetical protein